MPTQLPKTKFVAHKTLKHAIAYVTLSDSDVVMEVHLDIMKVGRVVDEQGKPLNNPMDGSPAYIVNHGIRIQLLTKEEWKIKKELMENGEQ